MLTLSFCGRSSQIAIDAGLIAQDDVRMQFLFLQWGLFARANVNKTAGKYALLGMHVQKKANDFF